jgi:hypothetical protein
MSGLPWWVFVVFFAALLVLALVARKQDAGFYARLFERDLATRGVGLVGILFGLFAALLVIYPPVAEALARRRMILVPWGAVFFVTMFVFFGAVLLLAGKNSGRFVVPRQGEPWTWLHRATMAVCFALALTLEFGLHWLMRVLGHG